MGSRRAALFLTTALVAFAGCGGDDDDEDTGGGGGASTTAEPAGDAVQQDAKAKSGARTLVTLVEACVIDTGDYSGCKEPDTTGQTVEDATVESAAATTFVIVSPSESGNEFRIEKTDAGALERTCETAGEGGCEADGTW